MRIGSTTPRRHPNSGQGYLDDAPSCPVSSAKPPVAHITLRTWWIVITCLTVTVDHGLGHAL